MPDIAMCNNQKCPVKFNCYRFVATPNKYQYYQNFSHIASPELDGCSYFIENKNKENENRQKK